MTFAWLSCYALAIARMGDLLRRSRVRRALDAATGAALVVFGVRLVTEQRLADGLTQRLRWVASPSMV